MVLSPGDRVGRFVVNEHWASQGSSEIWKAFDPDAQRPVVVRAHKVRGRPSQALGGGLEPFVEQLRSLNHPHLVTVVDAGIDGDLYYVASEDVQGTLLSDLIARARTSGSWPKASVAAAIVHHVGQAVAYLQGQPGADGNPRGHLGFDLSPASVVITSDGQSKLVEAVQPAASQDLVDTAGRGPNEEMAYVSPEVARNGTRGGPSDVFALGAILWELVTHAPPFDGKDALERLKRAESGQTRPLPQDLSAPWPDILRSALSTEPEKRPSSVAIFVAELSKYAAADNAVEAWQASLPKPRPGTERLAAPDQGRVDTTVRSDPPEALLRESRPSGAHSSETQDPFFDGSRDGSSGAQRFEILGRLGSGGMGEVYKALDRELDEVVALKKIPGHAAAELRSLDRLKREVRLARRLVSDHVCRIYDLVDLGDGHRGLTMEFIDGTTMAELMREGLSVDYQRIASWGADIASGIAAASDTGIVHRDLKPENVMIRRASDSAVVLDFGIAHPNTEVDTDEIRLTQAGIIMGTPLYMSPEQLANRSLDARSDLYGLGLILCELITGNVPRSGKNFAEILDRRVVQDEDYSVSLVDPATPTDLAETIDRLLMSGAVDRPSDPKEVELRLRAVAQGRPAPAWREPLLTQSIKVTQTSLVVRTWLPPLILLLAAVVVLGYFVTRSPGGTIKPNDGALDPVGRVTDAGSSPESATPVGAADAGLPDVGAVDAGHKPKTPTKKAPPRLPPAEEM